jgi:hypothetical protein
LQVFYFFKKENESYFNLLDQLKNENLKLKLEIEELRKEMNRHKQNSFKNKNLIKNFEFFENNTKQKN